MTRPTELSMAADTNELRAVREQIDRELNGRQEESGGYRLKQHLRRGMIALRDAEDFARVTMPAWPTADRIRFIYEQITADVLNGRSSVLTLPEALRGTFPVHDSADES